MRRHFGERGEHLIVHSLLIQTVVSLHGIVRHDEQQRESTSVRFGRHAIETLQQFGDKVISVSQVVLSVRICLTGPVSCNPLTDVVVFVPDICGNPSETTLECLLVIA